MYKKRLLITGAGPNGITGNFLKNIFKEDYVILTPSSSELDLTNFIEVKKYFENQTVDYVIHCATYRPNSLDNINKSDKSNLLDYNLKMYFSLANLSSQYEKMIYFGSGAEYDKSRNIIDVREEEFGRYIPKDQYGFGKYIMNCITRSSDNIYNLRLFGTINPYEKPTKNVISNLCVKAIKGLKLKLHQDCIFSFIDMYDVVDIIKYILTTNPKHKDFNVTNGQPITLSNIANIISDISLQEKIEFEEKGLNLQYTGNIDRLKLEGNFKFTPIEESINKVYNHYQKIKDNIDIRNIDTRWK